MKKKKYKNAGRPLKWTPEMVKLLRRKFHLMDNKTLAAELGVTISAVRNKALKMGLEKKLWYWTPEDEAYLLAHMEAEGYEDIAKHLGRKKWAVINKYRELTGKRPVNKKVVQ